TRTCFSILLNCNRKAGALFMPRFIEEFYYGNIDPQARSTKENKTVQKQMEILMKNEDLLTNALTDKPKKWFLDYVNAWGVVNGESNLDSFIMGFRLGANFAYEALYQPKHRFKIC
ncbi:MAG: DUF6809 family protein, partial [Anaerobutyricum sp.]